MSCWRGTGRAIGCLGTGRAGGPTGALPAVMYAVRRACPSVLEKPAVHRGRGDCLQGRVPARHLLYSIPKGSVAMKQSAKIALCGILCALSLVCMLLTVLPISQMGLPALAGVVLLPVILEIGVKWGWLSYACVALLSLLITPSVEAKVLFVIFFGYYPVLKALIERLRRLWLEWVIKLAVFNTAMVASYGALVWLFDFPMSEFKIFGFNLPLLLLAIANVAFILYDIALTGVVTTYLRVLHPRVARLFHL